MSGWGSGYCDGLAVAGLKLISLLFKFNSHTMSASHHGDSNMTDKFELHNKNLLSVPGPGPGLEKRAPMPRRSLSMSCATCQYLVMSLPKHLFCVPVEQHFQPAKQH